MTGTHRLAVDGALAGSLVLGAITAGAQTPGQFAIPRFVIGAGGGTGLSGGQFGLSARPDSRSPEQAAVNS